MDGWVSPHLFQYAKHHADKNYTACDWWHGVPQLFWKYYFDNYTIPSSCVEVDLYPVAVS